MLDHPLSYPMLDNLKPAKILDKLTTFYYVAHLKSFTKAAEALNISQSAITRQIQLIEIQLKHNLILRSSKGITLTPHGEILFQVAQKVIFDLRKVPDLFHTNNNEEKEILKISISEALLSYWFAEEIVLFSKKYPEIKLSIINSYKDLDFNIAQLDIAIGALIETVLDLTHLPLGSFQIGLYAHPSYLDKFGVPKDLKDLGNHQLIASTDVSPDFFGIINWHLTAGCAFGEIRRTFMEIHTTQALLTAANAGLGIVPITKNHPLLKKYNLVEILPDVQPPTLDAYFVYPANHPNTSLVIDLYNTLLQSLEIKLNKGC